MYAVLGSEGHIIGMGPRLIHREDEYVSDRNKRRYLSAEGRNVRLKRQSGLAVRKQGKNDGDPLTALEAHPEIRRVPSLARIDVVPNR